MEKSIVPRKYAPCVPLPQSDDHTPSPTELYGYLYSYYFNIELDPTMALKTKKRYLCALVCGAHHVIRRDFGMETMDLNSEQQNAVWKALRELAERRQLFLELASEARRTLLEVPRDQGG